MVLEAATTATGSPRSTRDGSAMSKQTFWCRWEEPNGIPDKHMVTNWPRVMKAWLSGYGPESRIWCARVDAETPEDAERIIRGCYGKSRDVIEMSWEPEANPLGWRPSGGRFPE